MTLPRIPKPVPADMRPTDDDLAVVANGYNVRTRRAEELRAELAQVEADAELLRVRGLDYIGRISGTVIIDPLVPVPV